MRLTKTIPTSDLAHVCWLGGSPCAGKSSVAAQLAARYRLRVYSCDDHFSRHAARVDAARHPVVTRFHNLPADRVWLRPVKQLLKDALRFYEDAFALILEDVLALPRDKGIIAEGAALLPGCVAPLGAARALWLLPTEAFQRRHYAKRPWVNEVLKGCTDPERAFDNWMARDARFARYVSRRARRLKLALVTVDGSEPLEVVTVRVGQLLQLESLKV